MIKKLIITLFLSLIFLLPLTAQNKNSSPADSQPSGSKDQPIDESVTDIIPEEYGELDIPEQDEEEESGQEERESGVDGFSDSGPQLFYNKGFNVLTATILEDEVLLESGFQFGGEYLFGHHILIGGELDIRSSIITNILIYLVAVSLTEEGEDVDTSELDFVEKTSFSCSVFLYTGGRFNDNSSVVALRFGPIVNGAIYLNANFSQYTTDFSAGGCLSFSYGEYEFRLGYLFADIQAMKIRLNNLFLGFTVGF